jgi:coenzyme Q-binding protein COQ10
MFEVVADVERYPEFLPWCTGLRVLRREQQGAREIVLAEMSVGFRTLRERYTSRVSIDRSAGRIDAAQTEGVFRTLDTHWRFSSDPRGTKVDFAIDFEFRSRVLGAVANAALGPVLMRMSHAFEARAKTLSQKARSEKPL